MANPVTYVTIESDHIGQRLDNFLLNKLKGVPKSHIYRVIRSGEVRINSGRVKPSTRLNLNDVVRIPPIRVSEREIKQTPDKLQQILEQSIIYQNNYFMVINKPVGLAVHGGSGLDWGVIEALRQRFPEYPQLELVHRIDRDTSGCLVIAKRRSWLRRLQAAWRTGGVEKYYIARLQGICPDDHWTVDQPLQKNTLQSGERMVRVSPEGKPSITHFSVLARFATSTLVKVKLVTGRTHQIRVHSAHCGHPIIGDTKYGQTKAKRLYLHAYQLVLSLDEFAEPLNITAQLPREFEENT